MTTLEDRLAEYEELQTTDDTEFWHRQIRRCCAELVPLLLAERKEFIAKKDAAYADGWNAGRDAAASICDEHAKASCMMPEGDHTAGASLSSQSAAFHIRALHPPKDGAR